MTGEQRYMINNFTQERAYHNTAILIFLKAVRSVMGDVDVEIGNSLNQGYYAYIKKEDGNLTNTDIHRISDKMEKIIAHDTEIVIEHDTVSHAIEKWHALGFHEKARLLEVSFTDIETACTAICSQAREVSNCLS